MNTGFARQPASDSAHSADGDVRRAPADALTHSGGKLAGMEYYMRGGIGDAAEMSNSRATRPQVGVLDHLANEW
jgi:hypothetical protein